MNNVISSAIVAGLMLAAAGYVAVFGTDDGTQGQRILGALMGLAVVWYANAAPKSLTPLSRMRCDPVREQFARRVTGFALTAGGLGYAATWLFAPREAANAVSIAVLGGALLVSVGVWLHARFARVQ